MTSLLSVCFALWCVGQPVPPVWSLGYGQAIYEKHGSTERFFLGGYGIWLVGFAQQPRATDAVVIGSLPLQVKAGRVRLAGGGISSTSPLPRRGTRLNFLARAQVALTRRLSVTYDHVSNAGWSTANPSINAFGLAWEAF